MREESLFLEARSYAKLNCRCCPAKRRQQTRRNPGYAANLKYTFTRKRVRI